MYRSKIQISIIFLLLSLVINAQVLESDFSNSFSRYGFRFYTGKIVAHAKDVENTSGSVPYALELEYSKRHTGLKTWNLCRCYPTTGFVFAYKNYDNKILGYGFHLSYFVQYHLLQNTRISPAIRGTGGIEYNSNPYHKINNPDNQSYSMHINFYLQIALNFDIRINELLFADVSLGFNHISNGGSKAPNRGINWPSIGAGIHYSPDFSPIKNRTEVLPESASDKKWIKRMEIYFSRISETFDEKERFMIYGSEFLIGRSPNNLNLILAGAEWNLDMSSKRRIEYYEYDDNPHRFSVLSGHEFIMGSFGFSQKIGVYLYDNLKLNSLWYHKWGINYKHKSNAIIGVEVKVHRHVAEFVSFKIGFQI